MAAAVPLLTWDWIPWLPCLGLSFLICDLKGLQEMPKGSPS